MRSLFCVHFLFNSYQWLSWSAGLPLILRAPNSNFIQNPIMIYANIPIICRLVYESMDEEIKDEFEPPKINGHAVPIKEGPPKSGKPVHRTQSLESEDLEMELIGQSYDTINEEDDQAGPLIPPPKGFGSPSKSPSGRPLSHSIPQVGKSRCKKLHQYS